MFQEITAKEWINNQMPYIHPQNKHATWEFSDQIDPKHYPLRPNMAHTIIKEYTQWLKQVCRSYHLHIVRRTEYPPTAWHVQGQFILKKPRTWDQIQNEVHEFQHLHAIKCLDKVWNNEERVQNTYKFYDSQRIQ
jgi:hypothetical protein